VANVERPSLSMVIAQNVRWYREAADPKVSQDDLAAAARAFGLDWTRSSVAAWEFGRRTLSIEEAVLLPLICRRAFGLDVSLAELTEHGAEPRLSPRATCGVDLPYKVLSGQAASISDDEVHLLDSPPPASRELEALLRRVVGRNQLVPERASADAQGDAEQRVARRLGHPPEVVAVAALRLWGRSFTEQRDAEVGDVGENPAQLRGRVTRRLQQQLSELLNARLGSRKD